MLLGSIQSAKITQVDLSPEAFAEASVQARLNADETMSKMSKKIGYKENNLLWTRHFQASDFYKNYQSHLAEADK